MIFAVVSLDSVFRFINSVR